MKILWYVNIVLPKAAKALDLPISNAGGWLTGQADLLAERKDVELTIINITARVKTVKLAQCENIKYILIPSKNSKYLQEFETQLSIANPDIVHIFGIEYVYNTNVISLCKEKKQKFVVSIQGFMGECAKHYTDGLPEKFSKVNPFLAVMKKLYYADSVALGKKAFETQGELEKRAIENTTNVIGRTHWDKCHTQKINPEINYFHVNENLRDEFYTSEKWCFENCEKRSIFLSQGFYPIKGFHQFLKVLPTLVQKYPDIHIYVGGQTAYSLGNKFLDIFVDYFFEYQAYIKKQIKLYNLEKYITFTGSLNAENMKTRFLKSNLFLSASTIENSPNSVGEAMILGVPVVSSDVGGTTTILVNNKEGFLYNFFDTKELIEKISYIFDTPQALEQISVNAIEHAHNTHNREQNTQVLINAYTSILDQN